VPAAGAPPPPADVAPIEAPAIVAPEEPAPVAPIEPEQPVAAPVEAKPPPASKPKLEPKPKAKPKPAKAIVKKPRADDDRQQRKPTAAECAQMRSYSRTVVYAGGRVRGYSDDQIARALRDCGL